MLLSYIWTKKMPVQYSYAGEFSEEERVLPIEVEIQFQFKNGDWTELKKVEGIIDTGATDTFISNSIVVPEILDEYNAFCWVWALGGT